MRLYRKMHTKNSFYLQEIFGCGPRHLVVLCIPTFTCTKLGRLQFLVIFFHKIKMNIKILLSIFLVIVYTSTIEGTPEGGIGSDGSSQKK